MKRLVSPALVLVAAAAALAASPPPTVAFQGTLRAAGGALAPNGAYPMVFRFFDAPVLGNELLVDQHTFAGGGDGVSVTNGLFDVQLGGGDVVDGAGPGTYLSLAAVFKDHAVVWLEIDVDGERLAPRARVTSAPYAFNATNLGGRSAAEYIDTSSTPQLKYGSLSIDTTGSAVNALIVNGETTAILAQNTIGPATAELADSGFGIDARGSGGGGYFKELDSDAWALLGSGGYGVEAHGLIGGEFRQDTFGTYARCATPSYGIQAQGVAAGAMFTNSAGTSEAYAAKGGVGVEGRGTTYGGEFFDSDGSAFARLASGDSGVLGYGDAWGGYFEDLNDGGKAWVGYGTTGVYAQGPTYAGRFTNTSVGGLEVQLGKSDGIGVYVSTPGGTAAVFTDASDGDEVRIVGGTTAVSITADGSTYAVEASRGTQLARLADTLYGVYGLGINAGGYFNHVATGTWARVAANGYKIQGSGSVSFVQNHPHDKNRVIVYVAPEGDEAAVYTRGSGRLQDGVARVTLGETFQWVANPDVGLTAYVTPRGTTGGALYVESVGTTELVVRSDDPAAADAAFDYMVWGLRIGFEEQPIVQPKDVDAPLPLFDEHRATLDRQPDLRRFTALDRYSTMEAELRGVARESLARPSAAALALKASIGEYVPPSGAVGRGPAARDAMTAGPSRTTGTTAAAARRLTADDGATAVQESAALPEGAVVLPVDGVVAAGDLLAVAPHAPALLRRTGAALEPGVTAVALGPAVAGEAPVMVYGIVTVNADAVPAPIAAGDLLVASALAGHAMRAPADGRGSVIGKALEPLAAGTGTIRILLMQR